MGLVSVKLKLQGQEFFENYGDETINYVQKSQDFFNIGEGYGDFSFGIAIPASDKNLELIQWYNDTKNLYPFNPFADNIAEMWINHSLYATGRFRLLEITFENTIPKDIRIQFFADITNLKELLINDGGTEIQIADLALWDNTTHRLTRDDALEYLSGTQPISLDDGSTLPLRYPMISQENIWHWQGVNYNGVRRIHLGAPNYSGSDNDIGILNTEIRPAIPVSLIVDSIFEKAGVPYQIKFGDKAYYENLYLWVANGNSMEVARELITTRYSRNNFYYLNGNNIGNNFEFDVNSGDTLNHWNISTQEFTAQSDNQYEVSFKFVLDDGTTSTSGIQYRYKRILSGVTTQGGWNPADQTIITQSMLTGDKIFDFEAQMPAQGNFKTTEFQSVTFTITAQVPISGENMVTNEFIPEVSCIDFLKGIAKTFNAVIYWDKDNAEYVIDHRTDWLNAGKEIDLTQAEDTSKSQMFPPKFFRNYNLNFEPGQDFRAEQFRDQFRREWGSDFHFTGYKYGEDYELNNPFTTSIFQEIVSVDSLGQPFDFGTDIPSVQTVEPEGDSVEPGMRIFYFNPGPGVNGSTITGGTYTTADELNGNLQIGKTYINKFTATCEDYSMNLAYRAEYDWTVEQFVNPPDVLNNLFPMFFQEYVNGVFALRARVIKKTAWLTFKQYQEIRLNDTIIMGRRPYFINTMEADFLTGKVDFELIPQMTYNPIREPNP